MTAFDLFVLAVVGASILAGALRGLLRAAIASAALILGLVMAAQSYEMAGTALKSIGLVASTAAAHAGGFLLIVGAVFALGLALGELLRGRLRQARLAWFDRLLGSIFGLLRGIAVCSVIYLALTAFPVRLAAVREARTAPALAAGAKMLAACTSPDVRTRFLSEYKRLTG